jgi:threonine dehydrogenase-like Zn-dependent dehydrogenase/predicted NBD/HSP70 family sugar kinase
VTAAADTGTVCVIDVGGTHLRSAQWSAGAGLGAVTRQSSPSWRSHPGATPTELQMRLVEAIAAVPPRRTRGEAAPPLAGIAFGAALDQRSGTVYASAPLWGGHTAPFGLLDALTQARPEVGWTVVNDVTAVLLHVAAGPARQRDRKTLLATISTGIACRTLDRRCGEIAVDGCGLQGEIGHLPARAELAGAPVTLRCDCGARDHVAAFASGPGIERMAEVLCRRAPERWARSELGGRQRNGEELGAALRAALDAGDELAWHLLDAVTAPVADVLRTALCLDPELDHLGLAGGVAFGLGKHYRRALLGHLTRRGLYLTSELRPQWLADRLVLHDVTEANGLVGAGLAALAEQTSRSIKTALCMAPRLATHRAIERVGAKVAVRRRPTPAADAGGLLLAPVVAGLCGTDLQMLRGLRDDPAPVIGHEGVTRVVAAGAKVPAAFAPGALVVVNPTDPDDPGFLLGHTVDGLLQERVAIPAEALDAGLVLSFPDALDPLLAALLEPLAAVAYAFELLSSRTRPACTLVVCGDGTIGHLAIRAAARWLHPEVHTAMVHHTSTGAAWSAASDHPPDVIVQPGQDLAAALGASVTGRGRCVVAALLATPRDATLACLELVLDAVDALTQVRGSAPSAGAGPRAAEPVELDIDLLGGVPPASHSTRLPGVDLAAVRARNCGGRPATPDLVSAVTEAGARVRIGGQRGVAAHHLRSAAAELLREPARYRELITHVVGLDEAARIMRQLASGSDRMVDGRRLIKLAVRISDADRHVTTR